MPGFGSKTFNSGSTVRYGDPDENQNVSAESYSNLILGAGGSAQTRTLQGNITIPVGDSIKVESNATFALGGNTVTMSSTASNSARIGELNGSISHGSNGKFIVHRLLTSGGNDGGWVNLASPMDTSTFEDWDDELLISGKSTGDFNDGCAKSAGGCFWSIKKCYGCGSDYTDVTDATSNFENGRGYEIYVADDGVGQLNQDVTVKTDGELQSGSVTVSPSASSGDWLLFGNPFASPVDFSAISFTDIDESQYFVANASGSYASKGTSDDLSVGQGFWVQADGSSPSVTFDQADKTATDPGFYKNLENGLFSKEENEFYLRISSKHNEYFSRATFKLDPQAVSEKDEMDFGHLSSPVPGAPGISSRTKDGKNVRINAFNRSTNELTIPVLLDVKIPGPYRIEAQNLQEASGFECIAVKNRNTGEWIDLRKSEHFIIDVPETGQGQHLLDLKLKKEACPEAVGIHQPEKNQRVDVYKNGERTLIMDHRFESATDLSVRITDLMGRTVHTSEKEGLTKGEEKIAVPRSISAGAYMVRIEGDGLREVQKVVFR